MLVSKLLYLEHKIFGFTMNLTLYYYDKIWGKILYTV